jgi:7-carboxy-7-deazaguanine synthase
MSRPSTGGVESEGPSRIGIIPISSLLQGAARLGPDSGGMMLTVNEIFYSIQGESALAGRPCVFVRLTACDLRCVWCDTPYAFAEGRKMALDEVLAEVAHYDCPLVEITGGEPLLQDEVYGLMDRLVADGRTVLLETGGHVSVARVPRAVIKIMDVKCPASGESARNQWENINWLTGRDQVKFVIRDRGDFEFACDVVARHALDRRCAAVLFSPVHGDLDPRRLAAWVLEARLPVRLQLQLHKYIWPGDARGV